MLHAHQASTLPTDLLYSSAPLHSLGLDSLASPGPRISSLGHSLFPVFLLSNQLQPVARLVFLKGFLPPYFLPKKPTCLSHEIQVLITQKVSKQQFSLIPPSFPLCPVFNVFFFESDQDCRSAYSGNVFLLHVFLSIPSSNADILRAQFYVPCY